VSVTIALFTCELEGTGLSFEYLTPGSIKIFATSDGRGKPQSHANILQPGWYPALNDCVTRHFTHLLGWV
jgi:hypothetical protein